MMLISICAKTELLPVTHQLPCFCVKFEIIIYYKSYLFACQIILKIPKISVCVSNYTEDTEDICSYVKLYGRCLFMCQIIQEAFYLCVKFEIIIYYQSYH